jgi:hypothetical protein
MKKKMSCRTFLKYSAVAAADDITQKGFEFTFRIFPISNNFANNMPLHMGQIIGGSIRMVMLQKAAEAKYVYPMPKRLWERGR